MPYIDSKNDRRENLRNGDVALNAGELNYQIFYYVKHNHPFVSADNNKILDVVTELVDQFLGDKPNYQRYNDMTGCLIRCAKEIKRRLGINLKEIFNKIIDDYDKIIADYEDIKIISNGDVE